MDNFLQGSNMYSEFNEFDFTDFPPLDFDPSAFESLSTKHPASSLPTPEVSWNATQALPSDIAAFPSTGNEEIKQ